jgi:predicted PurR-regulated permease PerM
MELGEIDRSRAAWLLVGALFGLVVLYVAVTFVGTLVFALFIYYATRPVYQRVRRRVGQPSLAAALALVMLALPAILLLAYALAIGLQELRQFASDTDLGPYEEMLEPYIDVSTVVQDPSSLLNDPNLMGAVQESLGSALAYAGFIGNGLLHVFVMFAVAFYLLRDGPKLGRWFVERFGDDDGVLETYLREVDHDLYKVFFGNILNAVFTAAIGAIVYSTLAYFAPAQSSMPYPALLGLLTGAASLIPVVGMKLVYVPVTAYLFGAEVLSADPVWWFPVAFAALSFVIVDVIPDLILRPYVSGRDLHVGLVMFAYILGPLVWGWYGIFLGPLVLVFVVHFARLVLPELTRGGPVRPYQVDPDDPSGIEDLAQDEDEREDEDVVSDEPGSPPSDPATNPDGGAGSDGGAGPRHPLGVRIPRGESGRLITRGESRRGGSTRTPRSGRGSHRPGTPGLRGPCGRPPGRGTVRTGRTGRPGGFR